MDTATLSPIASLGLALLLMALGAGATFLIGWLIPDEVFETAQAHGRYAGLGTEAVADSGGRRRRKPRVLRLPARPVRTLPQFLPQPARARA